MWRAESGLGALLLMAVVFGYFTFCGWAGVSLLRGRAVGRTLAIVAQFPQLLQLQTDVVFFSFLSGFSVVIYFGDIGPGFFVGLSSVAFFGWGDSTRPFVVGVNIVAWIILSYFYGEGESGAQHSGVRHDH
jgi:hypothetical protein